MKTQTYNITAQVYNLNDKHKQTLLVNELIDSNNPHSAEDYFRLNLIETNTVLVKILSVEPIHA